MFFSEDRPAINEGVIVPADETVDDTESGSGVLERGEGVLHELADGFERMRGTIGPF